MKQIILCFLALMLLQVGAAHADRLDLYFTNNRVKLFVTRSSSEDKSKIRVEIQAPERTRIEVVSRENPQRIVIDFFDARVTRNRTFPIFDSAVLRSVRLGVYPDRLRAVLELKTQFVPEYSWSEKGGEFVLLLSETAEKKEPSIEVAEVSTEGESGTTEFSASLWNKFAEDTSHDSPRESHLSNHLELKPQLKHARDKTQIVVGAKADVFSDDSEGGEESRAEARLASAYINYGGESYNIRVGNQVVTWGKTDEVSPLDNVNPEDLRDGIVRPRAERKLPIPIANVELLDGQNKLQGLFIPKFVRSKINLFNDDWALFGAEADEVPVEEDKTGGPEFGARASSSIDGFDFGLSYLSTISDTPSLRGFSRPPGFQGIDDSVSIDDLIDFVRGSGQSIGLEYNRREILGFEFETVWDSFGLRGDLAYVRSEDYFTDTLDTVRSPTVRYVLGGDYSGPEDFYVNLQFSQSRILDYSSSILFQEQTTNALYGEVSHELWNDNLKIGCRAFYGLSRSEHYLNPYLVVSRWEDVTFEVGLDLLGGRPQTLTGLYDENDQVYLIVRGFL